MSQFVLHPGAIQDLNEIWEYVASDSPDAADQFVEEIYQTIQSLVPFPFVRAFPSRSYKPSTPLSGGAGVHHCLRARGETLCRRRRASWPPQSQNDRSHAPQPDLTSSNKGKGRRDFSQRPLFNAGNDLRSHTLSRAVPSALRGLTSVFGMGTGGTPAVRSPTTCSSAVRPLAVRRWPSMLAANL
jgi:plasmid stabilization system protein ParE